MFATTGTIADVAFGADGTLYYALTGFDPRTYQQRTFLAYLLAGNDGELFAFFGESSGGEEGAAEPAHLFQSASRDGGRTFTAAPIHTQSAPNDGDAEGEEAENGFQDVYFTSSSDGGTTWSDDLRVNDRLIDRRFGARATGYITGPVGLGSTDEVPTWPGNDTRSGNEETGTQDVYATRVRFSEPADVFAAGTPATRISPLAILLGAAGALALGGLACWWRPGEPSAREAEHEGGQVSAQGLPRPRGKEVRLA